ncbi:MAG: SCO family protein [Pseudomonadota bacterium]
MKTFRIVLWAVVALAAAGLGALAYQMSQQNAAIGTARAPDLGGPFTLVGTNGETVTRDDILGKPHAVFFGYTLCPDVCPTSMYEMGQHMARLGERAEDLRVVFVSVDAERDTPDLLSDYLSAFDDRIVGLTGDKAAVDEAVKNYRAYYKVHEPDEYGNILIDHTASVMLFDAEGNFSGTIAYGENLDVAYEKLTRLIEA